MKLATISKIHPCVSGAGLATLSLRRCNVSSLCVAMALSARLSIVMMVTQSVAMAVPGFVAVRILALLSSLIANYVLTDNLRLIAQNAQLDIS